LNPRLEIHEVRLRAPARTGWDNAEVQTLKLPASLVSLASMTHSGLLANGSWSSGSSHLPAVKTITGFDVSFQPPA
jgi:hypothetical protein